MEAEVLAELCDDDDQEVQTTLENVKSTRNIVSMASRKREAIGYAED